MTEPIEGVLDLMHQHFEKTFAPPDPPLPQQQPPPEQEASTEHPIPPSEEEHKEEEDMPQPLTVIPEQNHRTAEEEHPLQSTHLNSQQNHQHRLESEKLEEQLEPAIEQKVETEELCPEEKKPLSEKGDEKSDPLEDTRHTSPVLFKNKTEPAELLTADQLNLDGGSEIKPLNLEMSREEGQPQELISYRALTEKFEMALSRIKHTGSPSEFAARQEDYLKKKESDLRLLKEEKDKLEKSRCSGRPLINSKSQHLLGYRPIQNRYKEIVKEKEKRLEAEQAEKKRREEQEEEKIVKEMEEHQKKVKNKFGTLRSKEAYYDWMTAWEQERKKKVEELAARQGANKQEEATFRPQLNEKSQAMMKKKGDRVPIYEKEPVAKKVGVDRHCTFKPNLNKTLKK